MFNFVLAVFLLLSPIIIFPLNGFVARLQWYQFGLFNGSGSLLQLQFFQYGAIFLFLAALFSKPKREFNNKYLGLLFAVYFWSVIFNNKTMESFFTVISGFMIYYLVSIYATKKKMFFWIIFSVSALNTIFAVLQHFGINLIYLPKLEIVGLMSYKTQLGIYQAIAIPIVYSLNPFLAIVPLVGLILSKSITAMIAVAIGMVYFFKIKVRKMVIPLLIILALTVRFFDVLLYKFSIRWDVWKETFSLIIKNIHGYGVGTFEYVSKNINSFGMRYDDPYSLYLGIVHALGILGLVAFIFFVKNSLSKKGSRGLVSACLVLAVVGIGYSLFDYARLAGTTIVLFALLEVENGGLLC